MKETIIIWKKASDGQERHVIGQRTLSAMSAPLFPDLQSHVHSPLYNRLLASHTILAYRTLLGASFVLPFPMPADARDSDEIGWFWDDPLELERRRWRLNLSHQILCTCRASHNKKFAFKYFGERLKENGLFSRHDSDSRRTWLRDFLFLITPEHCTNACMYNISKFTYVKKELRDFGREFRQENNDQARIQTARIGCCRSEYSLLSIVVMAESDQTEPDRVKTQETGFLC